MSAFIKKKKKSCLFIMVRVNAKIAQTVYITVNLLMTVAYMAINKPHLFPHASSVSGTAVCHMQLFITPN